MSGINRYLRVNDGAHLQHTCVPRSFSHPANTNLSYSIVRLILMVDPLSAHSIYPEPVSVAFLRLSFPFSISSLILIILYWHELMANYSVVVHPFVIKMRIPFFVTSGLLVVLQGLQIGLRFINIEYFNLILGMFFRALLTTV